MSQENTGLEPTVPALSNMDSECYQTDTRTAAIRVLARQWRGLSRAEQAFVEVALTGERYGLPLCRKAITAVRVLRKMRNGKTDSDIVTIKTANG